MKHTLVLVLTAAACMLLADGVQPAGAGAEDDPYQIATLDNLLWLSTTPASWSSHFIQTADIDASDTANWNDGQGWSPVGDSTTSFNGYYDGNACFIHALTVDSDADNQGLFGVIGEGTVFQLGLDAMYVHGRDNVGLVAGVNAGEIQQCYVYGIVEGRTNAGGVAGVNEGVIADCQVTALSIGEENAGIIAGSSTRSIVRCLSMRAERNPEDAIQLIGFDGDSASCETCFRRSIATDSIPSPIIEKYEQAGWNIRLGRGKSTDVWSLMPECNHGFPFLSWCNLDALSKSGTQYTAFVSPYYPHSSCPFSPETSFAFIVPARGISEFSIHDSEGRQITSWRLFHSGFHLLRFNGLNDECQNSPSGLYFAVLRSPEATEVQKFLLLK